MAGDAARAAASTRGVDLCARTNLNPTRPAGGYGSGRCRHCGTALAVRGAVDLYAGPVVEEVRCPGCTRDGMRVRDGEGVQRRFGGVFQAGQRYRAQRFIDGGGEDGE